MNAKDFKIGLVYKYTCPEGKCYIGQTYNEKSRKSQHKNETIKDKTKFAQALQKFGYENFKYEIIIKFKPTPDITKLKRVLNKLERRYIKIYNSDIDGYNITKGGEGVLGLTHSDEIKLYISKCSKEKMMSEEARKKISEANTGRIFTEESKAKMSKSRDPFKKKILKFDREDNYIESFDSIADAARSITTGATLKSISNRISETCQEKRKSAYDFIWKFE